MTKSMRVKLPKTIAGWIDRQVDAGIYPTSDALIRDAVRVLQGREFRRTLAEKLRAGLKSGDPISATPEFWAERHRELERRIRRNRNGTVTKRRSAPLTLSKQKADESLEARLLEALDSGEPIPVTPEFWRELRRDGRRQVAAIRRQTASAPRRRRSKSDK